MRAGFTGGGTPTLKSFNLADHLTQLGEKLAEIGDVALVFIDPITAFLGGSTDSHNNADVRALLAPLSDVAAKHNSGILGVTHLSKAAGQHALMRVNGSLAFVAAARGVYLVAEDPQNAARRLFLPLKNNIGPDGSGLSFRIEAAIVQTEAEPIETSRVIWDAEPATERANEVLNAGQGGHGKSTAVGEAKDWLRQTLADGSVMATQLQKLAQDEELAWATIRRAAKDLKVVKEKNGMGGGWEWRLPEDAQ